MTALDGASEPIGKDERGLWALLRADGLAVLIALAVTVAVELSVFAAARLSGAGPTGAMLASLAISAVWVALASPALAAGGDRIISCWLRGGIVADGSAVTLIVLWLMLPGMTFPAAVKIYCIFAAVSLAAVAVVGIGRTSAGRCALAVTMAVVLMAAMASPIWVGGPAGYLARDAGRDLADAAVWANPFFGVMEAMSQKVQYLWTEMTLMYEMTALGDTIPLPPVRWHQPVVVYMAVAAVGLLVSLVRRRR